MVLMTERLDAPVRKVSVLGAGQLHLSESLCADVVSLDRIAEVVVVRGESDPCQQSEVQLTVRNSLLDRLPNRVTRLHLENSKIGSLSSATAAVANITATNCHIDVLDISRPLRGEGASATFQDSTVRKIERLEMAGQSRLRMHRTSVTIVASKGLVLREGAHMALVESTVWPLADDSVLLGGGASISLENYPGKFSVKSVTEAKPSLTESNAAPVEQVAENNFFVGFVVCLVFVVLLSTVLLITCIILKKERAKTRTSLTINDISRSDKTKHNRSSFSDAKRSNSDAQTNVEIQPMLQKMNNVSEKVSSDKQNYLKEMTRIEENIGKIHEQMSIKDDVIQLLSATEKAKLSLLESEYESKILEIRISSWRSELEEIQALIQRRETFINCMKENRDNALLQVFKPYGNNLNEIKKIRTAKDFLTRMVTETDEQFKENLQKLKETGLKDKKSAEEDANDRIRVVKNKHEVNRDSISNKNDLETRRRKPKNEGASDLFQTLWKTHETTHHVDVKRASAELDPVLELRFHRDVATALGRYIAQLEMCVDFIVLLGNIVQEEV
ncbi:hypothetical protein C7M84_009660 [Penaeus vannamei]|uniref:Uncharacterized protein n=1 Tax=Penaeus vannamei TaxID=6689 RepID=A0A3R7P0I5_PENVA|nr:hypothetical protein C7M84_009660 [Penaeus vannamei]